MIIATARGVTPNINSHIEYFERLVADLKAIRDGVGPTEAELRTAPVIDQYELSARSAPCLIGELRGHPRIADGPSRTSDLWVIAPELGWARTFSRYYNLGRHVSELNKASEPSDADASDSDISSSPEKPVRQLDTQTPNNTSIDVFGRILPVNPGEPDMPRLVLLRNSVRCLHCGDVIESEHNQDYAECHCGNIAINGGRAYACISGAGLSDASYLPLHKFRDGKSHAGNAFVPFLNGNFAWEGGDGFAFHRLLAALLSGEAPDLESLRPLALRRLGYLVETVLADTPDSVNRIKLQALVSEIWVNLSEGAGTNSEDGMRDWLPSEFAGLDDASEKWGISVGMNQRIRRNLKSFIDFS